VIITPEQQQKQKHLGNLEAKPTSSSEKESERAREREREKERERESETERERERETEGTGTSNVESISVPPERSQCVLSHVPPAFCHRFSPCPLENSGKFLTLFESPPPLGPCPDDRAANYMQDSLNESPGSDPTLFFKKYFSNFVNFDSPCTVSKIQSFGSFGSTGLNAALRVFSVALLTTDVPSTSRHMPLTHNKQRGQAVQHCKHKLNCLQGNKEKNSHGCRVRPCSTRHICPCVKLTVVDVQSGLAALDLLALAAPLEVALSSALADAAAAAAAAPLAAAHADPAYNWENDSKKLPLQQ